jgi:hypothetical protein
MYACNVCKSVYVQLKITPNESTLLKVKVMDALVKVEWKLWFQGC